jgi:hypothetical protein
MLVIEVGVKFRAVSVKRANIFDQDCRLYTLLDYNYKWTQYSVKTIISVLSLPAVAYSYPIIICLELELLQILFDKI